MTARAEAELAPYDSLLRNPSADVPLLPNAARLDELIQVNNPVRVITSGIERVAQNSFFASGKWRMVNRIAWWNAYEEATPVIFGHYWRWPSANSRDLHSRGEPDLFIPAESHHWLGPKRNTYCVDFAVGARYKERARNPGGESDLRLGAVRWPEMKVVFDHGHGFRLCLLYTSGITRQAINKHIQRLSSEHAIVEAGQTRNKVYKLATLAEWDQTYTMMPNLAEDVVWRSDVSKIIGDMAANVTDIWQYGFTEIFNNALDHSAGTTINLAIRRNAVDTEMVVQDNGVGIFKKIQTELGLLDERHAILELAKGRCV